jgi:transcription elongation factor GreB
MKHATVVDPAAQADRCRVHFGAVVSVIPTDGGDTSARRRFTIVGEDESDGVASRIGWTSPMARALVGARVGDIVTVVLPAGERDYQLLEIDYPEAVAA